MDEERPNIATTLAAGANEARGKLRLLERRVALLRERIATMEVIDPSAQDSDRVRFGATVTVVNRGRKEKTYSIVGVHEGDPAKGKVSWLSPIAKALLGRGEGDHVNVELPEGTKELEIAEIVYRTLANLKNHG